MSEMAPEAGGAPGGGGNFFTGKILGIPGIVWLLGAAAIAYYIFSRNSGGGAASSTGGGGTIEQSGNTTTIDKGAISIAVTQSPPNKQPGPTPQSRSVVFGGNRPAAETTTVKAPGGQDLQKIAASYGIPEQQLVALNPKWAKYTGTGKPIPQGTVLKVPKK